MHVSAGKSCGCQHITDAEINVYKKEMLAMVSLSKLFEKHQEKYGREGLERSPQTLCIMKELGGFY